MAIGILTGSGTYVLPGLSTSGSEPVFTEWGEAFVSHGTWGGVDVLHISRHGDGHPRLSNHVTHRANISALKQLGATGVLAVTVCGAVDPSAELGSVVCFDDLHFLSNRLADGSLCTFFTEPGAQRARALDLRGAVLGRPAAALLAGASEAGVHVRDGGCYGHVDGPRFNTRPRSAGSPRRASPPCRRRPGRRPCCAASSSCRTRSWASSPTTRTASRTRRRRSRRWWR